MKKIKSAICVFLAVIMCLPFAMSAFAAAGDGSYEITSPYENVNWNSVTAYKTALHTHTGASDGKITLKQSIDRHVACNFDIVATTDHGTVNYTWEKPNVNPIIYNTCKLMGRNDGKLEYLGKEGVFEENGMSYTYGTANGDDYLWLDGGKKILRIPCGNEQNAISANAHVNSWFLDYTDDTITTYESAIDAIEKRGGICVINHPGEYTKAKEEIYSEKAYNENNFAYKYYIDKFAHLINSNKSCIGIDMNSKGDSRTRYDRILWDNLLKRFAADGQNVFAIASSDAHRLNVIDSGFTLLLMDDLTSADARKALENGEFFAASHFIGNYDELADIAAALKEFYGETELYNKVNSTVLAMEEKIKGIERGEYDPDETIGIEYQTVDDEGFRPAGSVDHPSVNSVEIDEATDEIVLNTEDALIVRWISDGKLVETQKAADGSVCFDLNDYSGKLGDYVRAEVFGESGILYTQAFLLDAEAKAGTSNPESPSYMNLGFFDCLFAIFNNWCEIISRSLGRVFTR